MGESNVVSMDVEETNALRAKLGLPPLKHTNTADAAPAAAAAAPEGGQEGENPPAEVQVSGDDEAVALANYRRVLEAEREARDAAAARRLIERARDVRGAAVRGKSLGEVRFDVNAGSGCGGECDHTDERVSFPMYTDLASCLRRLVMSYRIAGLPSAHIVAVVQSLGEDEGASGWVARLRAAEAAKAAAKAEKGAEVDGEEEKARRRERRKKRKAREMEKKMEEYDAQQLDGMRILHSAEELGEKEGVILTLADRGVLSSSDDELVSTNLVEERRQRLLLQRGKKKTAAQILEAGGDEGALLSKYDDPLEGESKRGGGGVLTLGGGGMVGQPAGPVALEDVKAALGSGSKTEYALDGGGGEVTRSGGGDYLTHEEVAAAGASAAAPSGPVEIKKKKKKRRKLRAKTTDMGEDEGDAAPTDLGTRGVTRTAADVRREEEVEEKRRNYERAKEKAAKRQRAVDGETAMDVDEGATDEAAAPADSVATAPAGPAAATSGGIYRLGNADWEAGDGVDGDDDLAASLARARRLALKKDAPSGGQQNDEAARRRAEAVRATRGSGGAVGGAGRPSGMLLTSTSEFVRGVGNSETGKGHDWRDELRRNGMDSRGDAGRESDDESSEEGALGDAPMAEAAAPAAAEEAEDGAAAPSTGGASSVFGAEPIVGRSMADTLRLLKSRGALGQQVELHGRNRDLKHIDKGFTEVANSNDGIRLEYVDDDGHLLAPRQAYREIGRRFHGIKPSRNSKEKELKREAKLLKQKKQTSVVSGAMRKLAREQKTKGTAHVVLPDAGSKHQGFNSLARE